MTQDIPVDDINKNVGNVVVLNRTVDRTSSTSFVQTTYLLIYILTELH